MPAPYSYDLRQKAIEAFQGGERKSDVCRMFNLSRNTLDLWLKRQAETGDYQAVTYFQQGCRHKITVKCQLHRPFVNEISPKQGSSSRSENRSRSRRERNDNYSQILGDLERAKAACLRKLSACSSIIVA